MDNVSMRGYPIEHGFSINSYAPAPVGATDVYANFENPMSWYDIAGDHDGFPELMVRIGYGKASDPMMIHGQSNVPIMDVRYSWNLSDSPSLTWTNKVHLAGRHEIRETVDFGEFSTRTVPFGQLPAWVLDHQWDEITFVSNERGERLQSSEGIYDFNTSHPTVIAGTNPIDDFETDPSIEVGLRGDWSRRSGRPELYLDPVDRSLHLVNADGGIWNVDGRTEVRYLNLDRDQYIDGWVVREDEQIVEELYRVPGGLVYSDASSVQFRAVELPGPMLRTMPPADEASWKALRQKFDATPAPFDPAFSLRAMFDQFVGEPTTIATGKPTDIRRIPGGLRFVTDALAPGERAGGASGSGPWIVTVADGQWSAAPVVFANPTVGVATNGVGALEGSPIRVRVENPGSLDVNDAYVVVNAISADGESLLLDRRDLMANGGEETRFSVEWVPSAEGPWQLEATVFRKGLDPFAGGRGGADVLLAQATTNVDVAAAPSVATRTTADVGWAGGLPTRILVVTSLLIGSALALGIGLRSPRLAT